MNVLKINLIIVLIAGAMSTASFTMEFPSNRGGGYKLSKQERRAKKQAQKEARKSSEFVDASTGESPRGSAIGENPDVKMPESWGRPESPQKRGVISEDIPASNLLRESSSSSATDELKNSALRTQLRLKQLIDNQKSIDSAGGANFPQPDPQRSAAALSSMAAEKGGSVSSADLMKKIEQRSELPSWGEKAKKHSWKIMMLVAAIAECIDIAHAYTKTDKEALKDKGLLEKAKIVGQKTYTLKAICGAAQLTKKGMNLGTQAYADLKHKAQTFLNKKPAEAA